MGFREIALHVELAPHAWVSPSNQTNDLIVVEDFAADSIGRRLEAANRKVAIAGCELRERVARGTQRAGRDLDTGGLLAEVLEKSRQNEGLGRVDRAQNELPLSATGVELTGWFEGASDGLE